VDIAKARVFPFVIVQKNWDLRFCIDYRKLNDVRRKHRFALPWIDDTVDMVDGAKWFSTLDLKSSYWQMDLHLGERRRLCYHHEN
jgi:hypothetical protein